MKCSYCGGETRIAPEQVGVDTAGMPVYHRFVYCDKCMQKWDLDYQPIMQPVQRLAPNRNVVTCPNCGSSHIEYMTTDVIGRKVKQNTSVNLNPLKPFTVLNHKEKVVSEGKQVDKWHCMNCGNVFTKVKGQIQWTKNIMPTWVGILLAFAFVLMLVVLSIIG